MSFARTIWMSNLRLKSEFNYKMCSFFSKFNLDLFKSSFNSLKLDYHFFLKDQKSIQCLF